MDLFYVKYRTAMDAYIQGLLINDVNRDNKEQIISDFKNTIRKLISGIGQCHAVIYGTSSNGKSVFVSKLMRTLKDKAIRLPLFMDGREFMEDEVRKISRTPGCLVVISEPDSISKESKDSKLRAQSTFTKIDIDRVLFVAYELKIEGEIHVLNKPIADTELNIINFVNKFNDVKFDIDSLISDQEFLDYFKEKMIQDELDRASPKNWRKRIEYFAYNSYTDKFNWSLEQKDIDIILRKADEHWITIPFRENFDEEDVLIQIKFFLDRNAIYDEEEYVTYNPRLIFKDTVYYLIDFTHRHKTGQPYVYDSDNSTDMNKYNAEVNLEELAWMDQETDQLIERNELMYD